MAIRILRKPAAAAPAPAPPAAIADETNAVTGPFDLEAHATPPAVSESGPSADDLDAMAAEEAAKLATSAPPSAENTTSHRQAVPGGPTNPSYDADKLDSTGENVKLDGIPGPRGVNLPLDVMGAGEREKIEQKREQRLAQGMSSTDSVDSTGKRKGHFETSPQGRDKHGMRLPDAVDYSAPVEEHAAMVGPRGQGAPKDTFHR